MNNPIETEAAQRGITRLCHFTPSRNLVHIASDTTGILATAKLEESERRVYTPTDLQRYDNHEGYICCSVEYPNAWYWARAQEKETLFRDWVILFIKPDHLWMPGTRFCSRNAAADCGRGAAEGYKAFTGMYASEVAGAQGRVFTRTSGQLKCCPTDEQAEVLVPDQISAEDVIAIGVRDETQARNEMVRLQLAQARHKDFSFVITPCLYDKRALSNAIKSGVRPTEVTWAREDYR